MPAAHSSASGRPLTTTSTTGVPVAATASSSSCWRPNSPSSRRSRNSPVVASAVRPDRSTTTTMATSAWRATSTASAIVSVSAVVETRAPGMDGSRSRRPSPQRAQHCRPSGQLVLHDDGRSVRDDPERRAAAPARLDQRLDVHQVAVVAHDSRGLSAPGPITAIAASDGASGRTPSLTTRTIDRRASSLPDLAPPPRPARPGSPSVSSATYGSLEQAEPELHPQHPADRSVEQLLGDQSTLERGPGAARRTRTGAAARGPRLPRAPSPPPPPGRRSAGGPSEHLDAGVVGDDDALEAPAVAQDRRSAARARRGRAARRRRSRPA